MAGMVLGWIWQSLNYAKIIKLTIRYTAVEQRREEERGGEKRRKERSREERRGVESEDIDESASSTLHRLILSSCIAIISANKILKTMILLHQA